MQATREQLINFLEESVFSPVENHLLATEVIKKKIRATRMRINNMQSPEKVEEFFWNAMSTDRGIDSYTRIKEICDFTFEDVRAQFKSLCGR